MISRIARLRAKKGFTIIELIVVIAIIGIMTSIVVSAMSYDNRPTVGKGMAKDIFYVAQDAALSLKITNPQAIAKGKRVGYFVEIDNAGTIVNNGYIASVGEASETSATSLSFDLTAPGAIVHDGSDADDLNCFKTKMLEAFQRYLSSVDNMAGTLYVIIDDAYRVESAYWKEGTYPVIAGGSTGYFADNNILDNGQYCCAYPPKLSVAGKWFGGK